MIRRGLNIDSYLCGFNNPAICAFTSMIEGIKVHRIEEEYFDGKIIACAVSREHVISQDEIFMKYLTTGSG